MPQRAGGQERIGRYEVLRRIATGGMAELFLAKHVGMEGFEKVVAIKRILAHLAHDEEFVNMFRDEARLVAKLSHPNIVQIYDLGKSDDSYFIAMEYIPGRNLASIAKKAKQRGEVFPPVFIAKSIGQACEALHYAHTRQDNDGRSMGIVHRDVSPQNIILSFSGAVKLVDFGIAKAATKIAHTRAGVLKGKYAYMSPEQIKGEEIDARSDVFSAGIVLFELLCGKRPFEKDNSIQTLKSIVQEVHVDPRKINPAVPEGLVDIINLALTKDRKERYQSAQELQIALEDFVSGSGERSNTVVVGEWVTNLFADELDRGKGGVVHLKGGGEVILPASERMERSDPGAAPDDDIAIDEASQIAQPLESEPPPPAPPPAVRGGGSIMGRSGASPPPAAKKVVPSSRPKLRTGDEEATAIATGESEPDLAEAYRAVGPVAKLNQGDEDDRRPVYEEEPRSSEPPAQPGYDDSHTELAGLNRPPPDLKEMLGGPTIDLQPAPSKLLEGDPTGGFLLPPMPRAPAPQAPSLDPMQAEDAAPSIPDQPRRAFDDDATMTRMPPVTPDDPWGDKTVASPDDDQLEAAAIGSENNDQTLTSPPVYSARSNNARHVPSVAPPPMEDIWDEKTSGAMPDDPAEQFFVPRVSPSDDVNQWNDDKTSAISEEDARRMMEPELAESSEMSVEEIAAKVSDGRDRSSVLPGDEDGGMTFGAEDHTWGDAAPEGVAATNDWAVPRIDNDYGGDGEALPAGIDAKRDVDGDSRTVAASASDYGAEGIELSGAAAFAYDEPTKDTTNESPVVAQPQLQAVKPKSALGAIKLSKVAAVPAGGVSEIGIIDEQTSELGTEELSAKSLKLAAGKSKIAPMPVISPRPPPSAPSRGSSRAEQVRAQAIDPNAAVEEGTYNEPNLPPGGGVLGDFDLEALFGAAPMAETKPLSPPDPLAGIGSTRVPPANVSLSSMLLDRPEAKKQPRGASASGLKSANNIRGGSVAGSAPAFQPAGGTSQPGRPPTVAVRAIKESSRRPGAPMPPSAPGLQGLGTPVGAVDTLPQMPQGPHMPAFPGQPGYPHNMTPPGNFPGGQMTPNGGMQLPPRPRSRMSTAQLVTIVVSCIVITMVLAAIGYVKLRPPSLEIRTVPPGARVFLGGQMLEGVTPLSVPIEPDREYTIHIVRDGFEDHSGSVRIPRDKKAWMASFLLKPTPALGGGGAAPNAPPPASPPPASAPPAPSSSAQ